jgi:uncharacterized protein (DUF2141 family)
MRTALVLLLVLLLGLLFLSCGSDEPTSPEPTTGTISGTLSLAPGMSGDLNNTRVAIYASYDDWANDRTLMFVAASGSGSTASYTISNVTPGTYYLDAWKDVNNSGSWDSGDLFGVYGTTQWPNPTLSPFQVIAGQTSTINVSIIVL